MIKSKVVKWISYNQFSWHIANAHVWNDNFYLKINLVVGYRGAKKGDDSKTLEDSPIWCSIFPWSIWHLFQKDRLKNETESAKKTTAMVEL